MRADAATERAVFAAVDALFDHLAECRLEEALAAFLPDADVALYGSEIGEVVVGPEALRRFLRRLLAGPAGPRFTLKERRVSCCDDVAWFTVPARVEAGGMTVDAYRLTAVLERRDGHWLWAHFSGAEPLPDRA